ncbi:hypothetical protein JKP88DRAFT_262622 [Tribonema minus]|uniref:Uncharacterized protein n=1 Tax=Tribonema minus TaxID=303371 RepID=A0A836CHQ4_9STRA|nr:hypothetical protein JKP88DRAFT_262622 [Tribonema minus]
MTDPPDANFNFTHAPAPPPRHTDYTLLKAMEDALGLPLPQNMTASSAFGQTEWVEWSTISITAAMNAAVAVICLFFFWSMRQHNAGYFSLKRGRAPPGSVPPDLPTGFVDWMGPLMGMREQEVLRYAGFDTLIFLRFYKLAFKVFGIFALYGLAVIIPANIAGGQRNSFRVQTSINSFNQLSMSNIQHYDSKASALCIRRTSALKLAIVTEHCSSRLAELQMWVHAFGVYLLTALVQYFLYVEFRFYKQLRHEYLMRRAPHLRTIVVEERQRVLARLERLMALKRITGAEPHHRLGVCGFGPNVNSIQVYKQQLTTLNMTISSEQARKMLLKPMYTRTGAAAVNSNGAGGGAANGKKKHTPPTLMREMSLEHIDMGARGLLLDEFGAGPIERGVQQYAEEFSEEGSGSNHSLNGGNGTIRPPALRGSFDLSDVTPLTEMWGAVQRGPIWNNRRRSISSEVLHCSKPGRMDAVPAPEPRDVCWPNIIVSRRTHTIRWLLVEVVLAALMVFFPVIVTLMSYAISADQITQRSKLMEGLCMRSQVFRSAVELLQPICLMALMSTLPALLGVVGNLEGIIAHSRIQLVVLGRLFQFQIINVFLVTTVAGSLFDVLNKIANHPSDSFTLLGETLPKVAGFFCDYVTIRALTTTSLELIRVPALLVAWIRSCTPLSNTKRDADRVVCGLRTYDNPGSFYYGQRDADRVVCGLRTYDNPGSFYYGQVRMSMVDFYNFNFNLKPLSIAKRDADRVVCGLRTFMSLSNAKRNADRVVCSLRTYDNPGSFYYGQTFAQDLLVLTLIMTYACIAPVILVPGLLFFGIAQVVYRHQLLYVYVPDFESGGAFFPLVFRRFVFALVTAQATMLGMFLLKNGLAQVYAMAILMVVTYVYKGKMRALYEPVAETLPLEIATALDLDRQAKAAATGAAHKQQQQAAAAQQQRPDGARTAEGNEYLQPELKEPSFLQPDPALERVSPSRQHRSAARMQQRSVHLWPKAHNAQHRQQRQQQQQELPI